MRAGRDPGRAVLIYDGECPACRQAALWLMRRAIVLGRLELLPLRSGPRRERYPAISETVGRRAMQLVLPDGRVVVGAEAVPELLRRLRGWRWLATALRGFPPAGPLTRRAYPWMARRRLGLCCPVAGDPGVAPPP